MREVNHALLYEVGECVEQNYQKAIEYYEKSIKLNDIESLYRLGLIYLNGKGVEQNITEAIEYLERAADLDNVQSLNCLASLYQQGKNGNIKDNTLYAAFSKFFKAFKVL